MQTLGELVSAALRQADAGVKVASLRDAPIEDRSYARVDDYLARELGQIEVESVPAQEKQASAAPAQSPGYEDVRFALKLAEALVHGAHVVEKLAIEGPLNKSTGGSPHSGSLPAGGPAPVLKQPFENARVVSPAPQASAHARAAANGKATEGPGEPKTDREMMVNGPPVIPSGYKKADVERVLRSKKAQHAMLVSLGQIDAANAVYKEAEEIESRANSLVFSDSPLGTHFPDNEGVRNLTKAQARDANQREAGAFFGEPVKRDNAVAAHTLSTHGLKLSQLKIAKRGHEREDITPGFHESLAEHGSRMRANVPLQAGTSAALGGIAGGMLGHQMGGGPGAALGALAGAGGLGALGYYGAKGEQRMRERLYNKKHAAPDRENITPGFHESVAEHQSRMRANVPLQAGASAVLGGLTGGILGHEIGKGPGAALGALVGAGGLGALGYYGAKGEQKMRERLYNKKHAAAVRMLKQASAKKDEPASLIGGHGAGVSSKLASPGTAIVRAATHVPGAPGVASHVTGLADKARKSEGFFGRAGQLLSGSRHKAMKELTETPHFGAYAAHNPQLRDTAEQAIKSEGNKVLATRVGAGVGAAGLGAGTYAATRDKRASKVAGIGDLAAGIGRGVTRMARGGLGRLDEGAGLLRQGTMGPHQQSMFARGASRLGNLTDDTHKIIGGTAMGLGAAGTGYLGARALGGGNR